MSRSYQRGMRPLGKQPGRRGNDRWDKNIEKLEPPPMRTPVQIRSVGGILTVGIHWVTWRDPNTNKTKSYQTLCPNWNLAEPENPNLGCPLCKHFHKHLQIKQKADEYLRMPQKFRYLFHAFHVTNIERNSEQVFGVLDTHALGIDQIEEAMLLKGVQPDDPKRGFCLHWLRKEAKQAEFKEEVSFTPGDKMEARWNEDKGVWQIRVNKRTIDGKEQDLLKVIPAPPTAQELETKLTELGLFTELDRIVGSQSRRAMVGPPPDAEPDADDWSGDASEDAGEDWPDSGEAHAEAPEEAPKETSVEPDDDWPDEPDAPVEESDAVSDGDDWEEAETADEGDADADDWDDAPEPEPEKPKRAKKKTTKKAAKKPAEKATKKKAPPSDPAPEDESDWDDDDWD